MIVTLIINTTRNIQVLEKIHSGHQGITRCTDRAKQTVWWPSVERQVREKLERCLVCSQHRHQSPEPLIPSLFPDYPFQRVATDLFQWKGVTYLLVVHYYSRFIEIAKLKTTTSSQGIMGKKLRTTVPTVKRQLKPKLPNTTELKDKEKKNRERQKKYFDNHYGAR